MHFNKKCTDSFYSGRLNIGDGESSNLKDYIYNFINEYNGDLNISNHTKKSLFNTLGIKDKSKYPSTHKNIDNSIALFPLYHDFKCLIKFYFININMK